MMGQSLKLAIGGMLAMAAGIGIGRFVYTPILPVMVDALELSNSQAGLIASANFLGYFCGALLAALPDLPGDRRSWLVWALAGNAVALGAMGLTHSMIAFLILRFIGGGLSAIILVFASALVLEQITPAERTRLSAVHFAGVGVGIVISAVTVSVLLMANAAWSHLWFGSAILCLAAMVAVHVLLPQTTSAGAANSANQNTDANVGKTGLALLIAAYGLFGFGYVITATFLVAIVRDTATIAALEPIIWLILGLAAAPSVALWAWSATRFGILPTYAVACLLEAVGVAASVLWLSAPGVITAAILLGGTFIGLTALGFMAARTFAAGNLRRALAGMTAAFGLGQIIGPALAGYLHDLTGSFVLPSLLAVAALIASAVFVSLLRTP